MKTQRYRRWLGSLRIAILVPPPAIAADIDQLATDGKKRRVSPAADVPQRVTS